ncbi:DUF4214 domain-containing protein [Paenibacillus sp. HJGM_3]|uniref:DUF4214 domain-containing protein n=1 Tax=Paenibacillus sp. HJGM_3 TaxID=3379816 RepID=UPI003858386B
MSTFENIVNIVSAPDPAEFVRGVYRELLQREAEPAGLSGHLELMHGGTTRLQVIAGIMLSAEYRSVLNSGAPSQYPGPTLHDRIRHLTGGSYAHYVVNLYQEMLGRACGPQERIMLLAHLMRGHDRLFMLSEVLRAPEFIEKLRTRVPHIPI